VYVVQASCGVLCCCCCRYGEPEYEVENEVVDGDYEGSMDGLKKRKGKKDKPTRAEVAELAAAQRAAQRAAAHGKVQIV